MSLSRRDLLATGGGAAVALAGTAAHAANDTHGDMLTAQNTTQPAQTAPAAAAGAEVPANEKKLNIVTLRDLEADSAKVLPAYSQAFAAGGAGDEWSLRNNEAAFNRWVIEANFLSGHKAPDLSTSLLGTKLGLPVISAPVGGQANFHAEAEVPAVKGTALANSLFVASSASSISLENIAKASTGPKWFQIYFPSDPIYAKELLLRAKEAGYTVIVLTVDATVTSNRERVTRLLGSPIPGQTTGNVPQTPGVDRIRAAIQKLDLSWDDLTFCASVTGLPVIVKSIMSVRNVKQAMDAGAAGVWISNHGGRQLDNSPAPMDVLPRIAEVVNGRIPIVIDGSVRRGQDVFRALALGASAVGIGRPYCYAMALGGAQGVQSMYQRLQTELQMVMQLAGVPSIKDISRDYIAPMIASA